MLKKFNQTALLLVVLCTTATTYAQVSQAPDGIQFQALATDANGHPAAGRVIYVKDAIVAKTATGTIVYSETFKVTASSAGIFTIVLGKGTYASGVSSIANIDWANGPFFLNLKIAVEPTVPTASWNVNNEYVDLGTSQFWSVPYALYAGNVKGADGKLNTSDTAAMLKPYFTSINLKANIESPTFTGTVSGITKAMVGLGNVDNTADINKPVSTATQTALDLKANVTDVSTALALKANTADVTTALALKANTADVNAALALKANGASVANSINIINTTLNTKANTIDVNNALIAKADVVAVNNAVAALNASLSNKENSSNKSVNVTTDAASDTKYPSVKAVKTYVDAQVAGATIADASATEKGKIQLAGDLAGTAAAPTVPGLAAKADAAAVNTALNLKANTADITTALATKANSSSLSTVATSGDYNDLSNKPIFSSTYVLPTASASALGGVKVGANLSMDGTGVLSATLSGGSITGTVAVANGGTGATTLTGLVKGSGTSALTAAVSGTDYLAPNGSAASLTNFPTFNQNTTGNAANVTGTVAVSNGGTGATTLTGLVKGNGTGAMTAAVAGTDYLAPNGSAASLTNFPTLNQNTTGNAANVTGVVAVANGGTGAATMTGYVKGTGTTAMTASATIPVADVTGAAPLASPTFTGAVTAPIYATTPQALTFGSPISWNPANGLNASVTLTGNGTLSFSSPPTAGAYGTLVVTQDGTGSRTLTLPTATNKVLGSATTTAIALSTAANAIDIVNFYYDGSNYFWNVGQGYGSAATAATTNLASSVTGTLPVANGGTGAATLTGLVKGNGTGAMTAAAAGTDYLAPTGSAAGLTNFPTLNQNTTGNAANVTGVVAVANGGTGAATLTGYVKGAGTATMTASATIPVADISGTLPVANGGTGAATLSGLVKGNGTGAMTAATAGTDYQAPITLTTTGTGAATLSGTTLNIPTASSGNTHYIGESYGGGIVFYIWDGGAHGLIGANTELNGGQAMNWGGGSNSYVGTTSFYGVLGGKMNTQRILNVIPVPTFGNGDNGSGTRSAAFYAATYLNSSVVVNGVTTTPQFSDWYLPNAYELTLFATLAAYFPNCNFATHDHWTSSERNDYAGLAYALGANSNTYIYQTNKSSTNYVVAIRSF